MHRNDAHTPCIAKFKMIQSKQTRRHMPHDSTSTRLPLDYTSSGQGNGVNARQHCCQPHSTGPMAQSISPQWPRHRRRVLAESCRKAMPMGATPPPAPPWSQVATTARCHRNGLHGPISTPFVASPFPEYVERAPLPRGRRETTTHGGVSIERSHEIRRNHALP